MHVFAAGGGHWHELGLHLVRNHLAFRWQGMLRPKGVGIWLVLCTTVQYSIVYITLILWTLITAM